MLRLFLITSAFAQESFTEMAAEGEAEVQTELHHPHFKVEFVTSVDFKPTFFADPRAVSGVLITDGSGIGFSVAASPEGIDMIAPQIPIDGLADMMEGFEVTLTYSKPYTNPEWNTTAYGEYVANNAKYDWNAMCAPGVDFVNCISTHYEAVMGTDEALTFCIDYCFSDQQPSHLKPAPSLAPTPMPTTFMPTWQPTPHPTAIYTQPCPTCPPTPKPTPAPTPCVPSYLPTPLPTVFPTYSPTVHPSPAPTVTLEPTPLPTIP